MWLIPKNWATFQHYKDRSPPWIKLHKDLLNDRAFMALPLASKALAPLLWLLASESKGGVFDACTDELVFRLRITEEEVDAGLKPLIDKGFFVEAGEESASNMLADASEEDESASGIEGNASGSLADASNLLTSAIPEREGEREGETEQRKKSARGSRLPADWKLPEDWKTAAKNVRPDWHDQHTERVAEEFRDYWIAQPGQKGVKTDWIATWRNWCRRDKTQVYPPGGQKGKSVNGQPYDPRQDPNWRPKAMPSPTRGAQRAPETSHDRPV